MPIDYSKWDKIELSDDSDIEVHPNVDKKSFIKWKQRDIHEKRQQRNLEIKSILLQLTMYSKLNTRVDFLLSKLSQSELIDDSKVLNVLNKEFDPSEKFDYESLKKEKGTSLRKGLQDLKFDQEEIENTPPYNEMIEDLLTQIKDDHPEAASDGQAITKYLKEHRAKIDDLLSKQSIKLDDLLYQKSMLISSDDYHTGFDRSFLNKDKDEDAEAQVAHKQVTASEPTASASSSSSLSKVENAVESISTTHNSPVSKENPTFQADGKAVEKGSGEKTDQELYDELNVLPATSEFAKIPINALDKSAEFLIKHPSICTEHQKDSLIMTAFDFQFEGNTDGARQVIHQSLLLQYISQLAGKNANKDSIIRAIKLFFSKLSDSSSPACKAFLQDVENTVNHIKTRCKVIQEEQASNAEEEALIQLKALDDSTTLVVNTPEKGTPEHEIFETMLSSEMRAAIQTGSLDEVNKVFASMKVEEAEKVLEIFEQCNVVGISGVLENEQEFEQLKEQYEESNKTAEDGSYDSDIKQFNTVNEVD